MAEHKGEYSGAIRRLQENDELEIGSTGTLTNYGEIDNYGDLEITSTGTLSNKGTLTNTGKIVDSSTGYRQALYETAVGLSTSTTGAVTLARTGLSNLSTTGTTGARALFRLPRPLPGVSKRLFALKCSTAAVAHVETTSTGITFPTTDTNHRLAFDDIGEAMVLEGLSTTQWGIISNVGTVTVSTDFST